LRPNEEQSSGKQKALVYTGAYALEINAAAIKYGISPFLIAAVIRVESGFNPKAKSGAGAAGLMQLMPATAKELGVSDRLNPAQNIEGGSKYLAQQIKAFGSIELGLAAYNAGAGNVRKYGGVPPFKETQNYVQKVMYYYGQNSAMLNNGGIASGSGEGLLGFLKNPFFWGIILVYMAFK
jgi:soluble lytic murein transglycosylase-like protein